MKNVIALFCATMALGCVENDDSGSSPSSETVLEGRENDSSRHKDSNEGKDAGKVDTARSAAEKLCKFDLSCAMAADLTLEECVGFISDFIATEEPAILCVVDCPRNTCDDYTVCADQCLEDNPVEQPEEPVSEDDLEMLEQIEFWAICEKENACDPIFDDTFADVDECIAAISAIYESPTAYDMTGFRDFEACWYRCAVDSRDCEEHFACTTACEM